MPAHLHTENLYKFDDVVSALQKSIRRGNLEQALFWAGELSKGFEYILYSRLWTIVAEDIGMAQPFLAVELFPLYEEWLAVHKSDRQRADELTMQFVVKLVEAPKNRIVDNLYLNNYFQPNPNKDWKAALPTKILKDKIEQLFQTDLFALAVPKEVDVQAALLQMAACLEKGEATNAFFFCNIINLSEEESALTPWLLQYLGLTKHPKHDSKIAKKMGSHSWYVLFEIAKKKPQIVKILKVLYQLYLRKVGSGGLYLAFGLLLCACRERLVTLIMDNHSSRTLNKKQTALFYNNNDSIITRRQLVIPDYAIDKHTDRGKGSAFAPHNIADLHTEGQKRKIPTFQWSPAEIAKSHGNYKQFADYAQPHQYSRMSHFFAEGALLNNIPDTWLGEDPYAAAVQRYYLGLEKKYGYKACSGFFIFDKMRPIWIANQKNWYKLV